MFSLSYDNILSACSLNVQNVQFFKYIQIYIFFIYEC